MYGARLADKMIQPVWVEVKNDEDVPYWLLFPGLDPSFFPASEAAEMVAAAMPGRNSRHSIAGFGNWRSRIP